MNSHHQLNRRDDNSNYFEISLGTFSTYHNMNKAHSHEFVEIYFLLSGEKKFFIKDEVYHLSKGDLLFIDRHELHRSTSTLNLERERYLLHFNRDINNLFMSNNALLQSYNSIYSTENRVLSLDIYQQRWLEQLFYEMLKEFDKQEHGYTAYLSGLLTQLLVFSARLNKKNIDLSQNGNKTKTIHPTISKVIHFVNKHIEQSLSLKSVSAQFCISPSYLSKLFREMTGFSFIEYLTAIRLNEAQRLLRETEWNIVLVSEKVGFQGVKYFYKIFKKTTGHTPLNYRKLYRRKE